MTPSTPRLRVLLLCHDGDRLDAEGLAAWLASEFSLAGIVRIRERGARVWRVARRELRRGGWRGLLDILAFRVFYRLALAGRDASWIDGEVARLRARYPVPVDTAPTLVVGDPNGAEARAFIARLAPDLVIARCKFILRPEVFQIPRAGTFVLHPGICPEYRNAHGGFWALVRRDFDRVGMTLLRVDAGVDTGPIFLQRGAPFDEIHESHVVIQQRTVTANLDEIARTLRAAAAGEAAPLAVTGRQSAVWGQPRLTAYWRWKRAARRRHHDARRIAVVS